MRSLLRNYQIGELLLLALCLALCFGSGAWAQVLPSGCTSDATFDIVIPASGTGLISTVVSNIQAIVLNVAQNLYSTIQNDAGYQLAVKVTLTLYVAIYGLMFMFGMTQITLADFMIRVAKVGVVALIISPGSWTFFNTTAVGLFRHGTDELIGQMNQIAVTAFGANLAAPNNIANAPLNGAFVPLDNALANLTSAKMHAVVVATFLTGPYGLIVGLLILFGLGTFSAAVVQVMWIYLMSVVVVAFLFALGPIFIVFILFSRTRSLFDGWINQLVSVSLQPIFMFAFFAFFSLLAEASLDKLLSIPMCNVPVQAALVGTPFDVVAPRFEKCDVDPGTGAVQLNTCVGYGGLWGMTGANFPGSPPFPLSIVDVLIFLIVVQLAWRFNSIAPNIAKDIGGAVTDLAMEGGDMLKAFKPFQDDLSKRAGDLAKGFKPGAAGMNPAKVAALFPPLAGGRPAPGAAAPAAPAAPAPKKP